MIKYKQHLHEIWVQNVDFWKQEPTTAGAKQVHIFAHFFDIFYRKIVRKVDFSPFYEIFQIFQTMSLDKYVRDQMNVFPRISLTLWLSYSEGS